MSVVERSISQPAKASRSVETRWKQSIHLSPEALKALIFEAVKDRLDPEAEFTLDEVELDFSTDDSVEVSCYAERTTSA